MYSAAVQAGSEAIDYRGPAVSHAMWDVLMMRYMDADNPIDTLRMAWSAILIGVGGGRSPLAVPPDEVLAGILDPEAIEAATATAIVYGVPQLGPAPEGSAFVVEYLREVMDVPASRRTRAPRRVPESGDDQGPAQKPSQLRAIPWWMWLALAVVVAGALK